MTKTQSNKMPDSNDVRSDPTAIRQSFRVPVEHQDNMNVMIDDSAYLVTDISPEGVNIVNKGQKPFTIGKLLENCELNIHDSRIKDLAARIVHCSCSPDKNWNIGIQWINLTDESQQKIASIVSKIKQRLRKMAQD